VQLVKGVFKGGGAKGALYAGALEAVQEHDIWFSEVAGASAGAITAAFVAAGARPDDLRNLEEEGRGLLAFPSTLTRAMNLRDRGGILSFEALRDWLSKSLKTLCVERLKMSERCGIGWGRGAVGKNGPTFEQLADAGAIPLHIACADLSSRAPVVFNVRLTPKLYVAHAAAASSSIPFVFQTPDLIADAKGALAGRIMVSDGGVMANLPMFVFTDDAFRAVADLGERGPEPVVGFTFVDRDASRFTGQSHRPGKDYRERFKDVSGTTTFDEQLVAAGLKRPPKPKKVRQAGSTPTRWHVLVVGLLSAMLRVVETVVLPPLSFLLGLTQWRGYPSAVLSSPNRRARRWIQFGDRVTGVAPGLVVLGALLVIPALVFGLPAIFVFLWPDWHTTDGGLFDNTMHLLGSVLMTVLAVVACLLVVVIAVLGLVGYLVGWVAKPVAALVGPDLVATFMRNPQEPAWAGAGGDDVIIRIVVPEGWTALRSTEKPDVMAAEIECARVSVGEQLERAGLGSRE
jgi:predicted acylesterase/phospholipase RssA